MIPSSLNNNDQILFTVYSFLDFHCMLGIPHPTSPSAARPSSIFCLVDEAVSMVGSNSGYW